MPIGGSFRGRDDGMDKIFVGDDDHAKAGITRPNGPTIETAVLTPRQIFEEAKNKRAAIEEECQLAAKRFFKSEASKLFEKHPAMEQFRWNQYTPYWNDGDQCYFRVYRDYIWINDGDEETNGTKYNRALKKSEPDESAEGVAAREVIAFLKTFAKDDFEDMFGDHVKVTVTKDGVEVEECEHE